MCQFFTAQIFHCVIHVVLSSSGLFRTFTVTLSILFNWMTAHMKRLLFLTDPDDVARHLTISFFAYLNSWISRAVGRCHPRSRAEWTRSILSEKTRSRPSTPANVTQCSCESEAPQSLGEHVRHLAIRQSAEAVEDSAPAPDGSKFKVPRLILVVQRHSLPLTEEQEGAETTNKWNAHETPTGGDSQNQRDFSVWIYQRRGHQLRRASKETATPSEIRTAPSSQVWLQTPNKTKVNCWTRRRWKWRHVAQVAIPKEYDLTQNDCELFIFIFIFIVVCNVRSFGDDSDNAFKQSSISAKCTERRGLPRPKGQVLSVTCNNGLRVCLSRGG